ncbi:glycine/betaine/sarcosine/D-proline family reductase selenoprotein B [Desulfobulbus marinus]|nr:glycine/betaine/sarcosine/D-proline family reductase selenoprotein B [Desulfogranum marinum]
MKKAIVYLNQFFGQIGGESTAGHQPAIKEGGIGPAQELNRQLQHAEVTHTVVCGDNYMVENEEEAVKQILELLSDKEFDIFISGPAFKAGRYGLACGAVNKAVHEAFSVPVITSMHTENPGVDLYKKELIIFSGGESVIAMDEDLKKLAVYADKILTNQPLGTAEEEGYHARGNRHQIWRDDQVCAADRVVDMLLKKIHDQPFESELPVPKRDNVPIAPPLSDLATARIAVLTSGGVVPVNNPDHIRSASATRWGKYSIEGMERLEADIFKTIHGGYDPTAIDADPNICVPIDVLRAYEAEGKIGHLYEFFYSTVGTGVTQSDAARMGREIVEDLLAVDVDAAIMIST